MEEFATDIPIEVARAAHSGTSFVPDERARQERANYTAQLTLDLAELAKLATTPEKEARLAEEFQRYRAGFRKRYLEMLAAKARCVSTMIAGPSGFPARRQEKIGAVADKRTQELIEYRARAIAAIRKVLTPELAPIAAGDPDAEQRLSDKIAKESAKLERMKLANAIIRKHRRGGHPAQHAALVAIGYAAEAASRLLQPDELGRIGYADYQVRNLSANIRRMKERATVIAIDHAAATQGRQGSRARLEDAPAENRVRLFFPGKPDELVRARLKRAGFRWTPSLGCWQAYRNVNSIAVAEKEAG